MDIFRTNIVSTLSLFLLLIMATQCLAQSDVNATESEDSNADEVIKASSLKLIRTLADEAGGLRLWENRALTYAVAGDVLFDEDSKEARKLFEMATQELSYGVDPPKSKTQNYFERRLERRRFTPRRPVLLLIAKSDPIFALDSLLKSRPLTIQTAINDKANSTVDKKLLNSAQKAKLNSTNQLVEQELRLEQLIAKQAAAKNPELAVKLFRESIKDGVSDAAFGLLQEIEKLDLELAKELAGDFVSKYIQTEFTGRYSSSVWTGTNVLRATQQKRREKKKTDIKELFSTSQLKQIADKVIDHYLKERLGGPTGSGLRFSSELLLEFSPGRKAEIEARFKKADARSPGYMNDFTEIRKLTSDKNLTAAQLIEKSKTFRIPFRPMIYDEAIKRASKAGTLDDLRNDLEAEPDSVGKTKALEKISTEKADAAAKSGDLNGLRTAVADAEDGDAKFDALVNAIITLSKNKDEESRNLAFSFMDQARSIAGSPVITKSDVDANLKLLSAIAALEPTEAVGIIDNLIERSNSLWEAQKIVAEYDPVNGMIVDGEAIFSQMLTRKMRTHIPTLKTLAKTEFDALEKIAGKFRAPELKILVRLLLVQAATDRTPGFPESNAIELRF